MKEIWKDVKNYEGLYQVSNLGRVKSLPRHGTKGKILKPMLIEYLCISASKNNKTKKLKIHRLVAEAFLLNPNNFPEVNHKDGNKQNNNVNNLEWISHKDNINHAIKNNLKNFNYKGKIAKYIQYDKRSKFYYVCIWENGKNHYLGNYKYYAQAIQVRDEYLKNNNIELYNKILKLSKEDERMLKGLEIT